MDRPYYFQTALSNFTTDVACGGAIRHLTDIGYTLDQIVERLDYPASRTKVQKIMMDYLYESQVLLREEPSAALFAGREEYVQEQDVYGRRTLRKIIYDQDSQYKMTDTPNLTPMSWSEVTTGKQDILWKETSYDSRRDGKLTELLYRKCQENGENFSYVSCCFRFLNIDSSGYPVKEENTVGAETINCLHKRQQEYLRGIRWENPVMYHRLNQRMREIIGKLYEAGAYSGVCYFAVSRDKIRIVEDIKTV